MNTQATKFIKVILVSLIFNLGISQTSFAVEQFSGVKYKTVTIDGLDIFYREAGNPKHPTILLLRSSGLGPSFSLKDDITLMILEFL